VAAGGTIKIINQSQENVIIVPNQATAQAATNEINAGNIDPGASKILTLTIHGSWGFYNQKHPTEHASITVQ
jgi:hypothetical protein